MLAIDDNIPIPEKRTHKYPFGNMKVGQSFFAPNIGRDYPLSSLGNKRFHPKKFRQSTVTENGVTGLRVWRIE